MTALPNALLLRALLRIGPLLLALSTTGSALFAQTGAPVAGPPAMFGVERGSLRAVLMPIEDIRLSSRAAGVVEGILAREGDRVRAGQILIELNAEQERSEVAQAEAILRAADAVLEKAEKEFERADRMRSENITSDKHFEEATFQLAIARSELAKAEAVLRAARDRLDSRSIRSPIDGLFFKKNKSIGEAVGQFETVARVIDDSEIELVVYAGASMFGHAFPSGAAAIELMDGPGRGTRVSGRITHIDSMVDPSSGTFRIKIRLTPSAYVAAGFAARLLQEAGQ